MTTKDSKKNRSAHLSFMLGSRLRSLRCDRGLTQEEVAHRADIATYTYQKYEYGESKPGSPMNPTLQTLTALSDALDVRLSDLLDFENNIVEVIEKKSGISSKDHP